MVRLLLILQLIATCAFAQINVDSLFKANKVKKVTIYIPTYNAKGDTINTLQILKKQVECYFDSVNFKPVKIIIYAPTAKEYVESIHKLAYKTVNNRLLLLADTAYIYHLDKLMQKDVYIFKQDVPIVYEVAAEDLYYYNSYIKIYKRAIEDQIKAPKDARFYTYVDKNGLVLSKVHIYQTPIYALTTYFHYEFY